MNDNSEKKNPAARLKDFIRGELSGWRPHEIVWLVIATAVILALSIYWKESQIGLWAALTGVWCVVLTGQGKRSSFIFGAVNVVLYALVALKAKYYGEVMLNLLYYFPMSFVGWFLWTKNMNSETGEVRKTRLPLRQGVLIYGLTAVGIGVYGLILKAMGGNLPFMDSMSTVVSVTAQILSVKRLTEQWILWIAVDAVTIVMWAVDFARGGENLATLAMWAVYLINAVIMFIRWNREATIRQKRKAKNA